MRTLLRVIAVLAAATFLATAWQIASFGGLGALSTLLTAGAVGWLTAVGWLVTLVVGPITTIQLWRLRASGRLAGVVLFGVGGCVLRVGRLGPQSSGDTVAAHRGGTDLLRRAAVRPSVAPN